MSDSPDLDLQNPLRRSYKTLDEAVDKKQRKKAYSDHFTAVYNIFFQALPDQLKASSKGCVFAISDNEETLISGNSYGNISIINRKSKEILYEKLAFSSKVLKLLVENGHLCCIVAGLNSIFILDKNTLESELSLEGHSGQVTDIIIHQKKLYSTGEDFTLRAWDTTNWSSLKTLFQMDCKGNSLDISSDGKFLACGNSSKSIILYEFEKNETFSLQSDINQEIYAVKFAENFKYLASAGNAGKIEIWNTGFWDLKFYIDIECIGSSLKFIRNDEFIIAGCSDGFVKCWRLFDQKLFSLENHKGAITSFYVSKSEKYIISSAEDRVFLTSKIPDLQEEVLHGHKGTINYVFYSKENDLIISAQSNGIVIFWNSVKKTMVKEVDYNCNFTLIIMCPDETCLVCATDDCRVFIINLDSYEIDNMTIREKYEISAMKITPNSEILIIGNVLGQLKLINFNDLSEIRIIKKMSLGITSIDSDNKFFYAGSLDGKVLMENLEDENDVYVFPGKSQITCLSLSPCRKRLYAGSGNNLNIWSTKTKEKLMLIEMGAEVKNIYFKYLDYFMTFSSDSMVKIWSQRDYTLISSMPLNSNTKGLILLPKEKYMITTQNNHLLMHNNPWSSNSISTIGDEKHKPEFMKYLVSITEQTSKTHKSEMDSYLIAPYFINALHFYAYYNMKDHLLEALNYGSPLFMSKYGYSPLTISLDLMHDDCTIIILNHIKKALRENIHTGYLLENALLEINLRGFNNINKLYDSMLTASSYKNLPKFCNAYSKLPAVIHSKYIEVSPNKFPISYKNKDISIIFQQSTTRFSLENGSVESMNFISSLIKSPNNRVFTSEVVKYILHEKWRVVRWSLYLHALIYIHYLALLSTYAVGFQNDVFFASLILTANFILILPEIYKILTTGISYWLSVMNNVDVWRFIMCTLYCSFVFKDIHEEYKRSWLIFLVLFSWIRGIGLFALFEQTRFLVNMIKTVIIEMLAFFVVLAYSTLAFAFFEHAIEDSDTSDEFFDYLLASYMFTLGDFGDGDYSDTEWIIVILVSILNSMILLNFLISIIFNTFGKVQEEKDAVSQRELAKIILEGESIQFWKRKSKPKYLQVCKSNFGDIDGESDKLKKYRKEIIDAVKETSEEIKNSKGEIIEYVERSKINSENDLQKNFEMLEKRLMENMEKKFGEIMERIEKKG
ncbi:unnamed protein product [Blepharisma stoltei]|uniref:Ion transport domain-containing protein n=1 Tax=Blepharisma stoltei TaxID=1481888 RepID=A0AAU9KJW0_9CILI|nr:unnamed protein product [Blepharisma stoltei]